MGRRLLLPFLGARGRRALAVIVFSERDDLEVTLKKTMSFLLRNGADVARARWKRWHVAVPPPCTAAVSMCSSWRYIHVQVFHDDAYEPLVEPVCEASPQRARGADGERAEDISDQAPLRT